MVNGISFPQPREHCHCAASSSALTAIATTVSNRLLCGSTHSVLNPRLAAHSLSSLSAYEYDVCSTLKTTGSVRMSNMAY